MKKIINYLKTTLKAKKNIIIFCFILFICGVIFGTLFINFISKDDKKLLIDQITTYVANCKKLSNKIYGLNAFKSDIISNELQLILIYILGLSIIGVIIVILVLFFKGFMLGVSISIMLYKYGLKGILLMIFYLIPSNLFNILVFIFISIFAINTSLYFISALIKKGSLNFKYFIGKYTLAYIVSFIMLIICSILNTFLTPLLIKVFTYI